jgi:ABC-type sugar transport system ATPase subunit
VAEQQMVEIAKAMTLNAKLIIMDEPTAALSRTRGRQACTVSSPTSRMRGISVIYVSRIA